MKITESEYKNRLADIQRQVAELREAEIAVEEDLPKPPHPRWRPAYGEKYFFTFKDGSVSHFDWDGGSVDTKMFEFANLYKSEHDVRFAVERRKVLAEMTEWAGNWRDCYALGYDVCESPGHEIIVVEPFYPCGEMRFASKEDAENCIKSVGADRIKKYYFGISEGRDGTQT